MRTVNREIVLYPSLARTVTPATENLLVITNIGWTYALFLIDTTAAGSSPTTVFTVQAIDELGVAYDLLASAAVVATGKTQLHVGPGLATTANVSANMVLPYRFRLNAAHGNATSHTYDARVHLIGG